MDPSDWRHIQGANDAGGDTAMESGDWRAQLQRQRIVNKIMDTLKMHLPFSRHEGLQELKNIAERVEEEIYTAVTSHSEYSRKICYMMLTMETRSQSFMSDPVRSNSGALYNSVTSSVPLDLTAQTGNRNGGNWQEEVYQKIKDMKDLYLLDLTAQFGKDWQEEAYQKIKAMKDLYLLDLKDLHQKVISKLQQHDSLPHQLENEQLGKLKVFKNMLERYIQLLQIPKHGIIAIIKDKLGSYEKQIIQVINLSKRRRATPQQQAQTLPPSSE